ncbi:MAG TPA: hypothetical protein VMU19_12005 [Bryobacteraceae bacterium]|nr:hypothetical protein [Bryobacteraceae bacterium]
MRRRFQLELEEVVAAVNADVRREIRMADECVWRAAFLARADVRFGRRIMNCAAASLSNATALAAEVVALGGTPPAGPPQPRRPMGGGLAIEEYLMEARLALAHYRSRLFMARRFGLERLWEVYRGIVHSKAIHAAHAALVAAAGERPRQLS